MNYNKYNGINEIASRIEIENSFFGKNMNGVIDDERSLLFSDKWAKQKIINNALKIFSTDKSLWNYLYSISKKWIDEANNDPYFNGKKCKNGNDLIQAIKDDNEILHIHVKIKNEIPTIYICGDFWLDDEHGFSVNFINGEFIKCKGNKITYNNYTPTCTVLGSYDEAL